MENLRQLPNIGEVLERNLHTAGINTPAQLLQAGSRNAFIRIRLAADSEACLHVLYALQGAVEGVRYPLLSAATKQSLKRFYSEITAK